MSLSSRFKAPEAVQPYHILSIEGLPKHGKTRLAASAPGIVGFQSLDFGTDGVLQAFPDFSSRFLVAEYRVDVDVTADALMQAMIKVKGGDKEALQSQAYREAEEQALRVRKSTWAPFVQDYESLLEDPSIRTIVWDTASEVNELVRLCHFGKLEKNPKIAYGPINAEFKGLIRKAAERRKNLVLVHHLTEIYVNEEPSGKYKLKGNGAVEGLVHSYVRIEKKQTKGGTVEFHTTVRDARFSPAAVGKTLVNAEWTDLMEVLMPEIDREVWGG
jgi:hypothetical protein